MTKNTQNSVSLKVETAYTRDLYRGIARIDYDAMDALNVSTGSVIEIVGDKRTVAKVLPLYPSDDGKELIRIDELTKGNAGAITNQPVMIKKISAVPAKDVTVIPLEKIPPKTETYLRDYLEGQPLTKEQKIVLPYFREWLEYKVTNYSPSCEVVLVTSDTKFQIETGTQ